METLLPLRRKRMDVSKWTGQCARLPRLTLFLHDFSVGIGTPYCNCFYWRAVQSLSAFDGYVKYVQWSVRVVGTSIRQWIYREQAPAAYIDAYIRYMQHTETLHPFLSIFERYLMSRAWMVGVEHGTHMDRPQNQDSMRS